jgi:predicted TIM-barrel fold metal-dependent hydrolase
MAQAFQAQVVSMVVEGLFERFPALRVVLVEGGFGWLPSLMWRMDKHWARLRGEVPHLTRPPSEYVREHLWVTTQPIEEPPDRASCWDLRRDGRGRPRDVLDRLPALDFDDPDRAIRVRLDPDARARILGGNAMALYGLD